MAPRIIYITGFRQNAGKTVTSVGLLSLLRKRYKPEELGYIKPVGQELISLPDGTKVDKDAGIVEHFCHIPDIDMKLISPVRLASGLTKSYLESAHQVEQTQAMAESITQAFQALSHKKIIVAEGTGHPGVGSIVGLSNAAVSNLIGAQTIFLSGGGLGKALDQLEVDLTYFLYHRVNLKGVVFNKLILEKIDQVKNLITEKLLAQRFSGFSHPLRIFGYLPLVEDLYKPSMKTLHNSFPGSEPLGNLDREMWEYPLRAVRLISLPDEYLSLDNHLKSGDLVVIGAGSRVRLNKIIDYNKRQTPGNRLGGIILTCGAVTNLLDESRRQLIDSGMPGLYVQEDTSQTEAILDDCFESTKIQVYDQHKIKEIEELFEQHFDLDYLLDSLEA